MRALIFGSIGVLAETSELQRQAYNKAFAKHGLDWHWNIATYCQLLATPGAQRRLKSLSEGKLSDIRISQIHETNQQVFGELMASGVSARPGIIDSIALAGRHGLKIGFITTTTPEALELVQTALDGQIDLLVVDVMTSKADVAREKPDSEAYIYALGKLGIDAADALAFEDTAVKPERCYQRRTDVPPLCRRICGNDRRAAANATPGARAWSASDRHIAA